MSIETIDSLWQYCTVNERVIPKDWNKLYSMLRNRKQKPTGGWEPSLPLILGAWHNTLPIENQLRFKEHILWASEQNQLAEVGSYLRSLSQNEWYHFREL